MLAARRTHKLSQTIRWFSKNLPQAVDSKSELALGSKLEPDQGALIKGDENPFELDESKRLRYTVSTIKLHEQGATLQKTQLALKAKEESELIKPTWKNVDTKPKALQHMTDADLLAPEQDVLELELPALIAEARSKIRPVIEVMTKEEIDALVISLEEAKQRKDVIINCEYGKEVLAKIGITHLELKKIQDKHYEIDVEYELTRDLYEKQRVIDKYLEAHQEDN